MTSQCHDQASRFVYLLTRGKSQNLAPEDFVPLVQDVVDTHPGLSFLKEATEFHSRYVHTVSSFFFGLVVHPLIPATVTPVNSSTMAAIKKLPKNYVQCNPGISCSVLGHITKLMPDGRSLSNFPPLA